MKRVIVQYAKAIACKSSTREEWGGGEFAPKFENMSL